MSRLASPTACLTDPRFASSLTRLTFGKRLLHPLQGITIPFLLELDAAVLQCSHSRSTRPVLGASDPSLTRPDLKVIVYFAAWLTPGSWVRPIHCSLLKCGKSLQRLRH